MTPFDGGVLAAFLLGLTGGAHCLGMCGPLVSAYTEDRSGMTPHALFNAGRTVGYAAVGAVLGALGGAAFDAASLVELGDVVRGVAGIVAGGFILVVGVRYLRGRPAGASLGGAGTVGSLLARVQDVASGRGIAVAGAAHALLPCPVLYPAFLYALVTGSALRGGVALAAVGLGTFPTLFAYGSALDRIGVRERERLHRALGGAFVLLAVFPISHGARLLG